MLLSRPDDVIDDRGQVLARPRLPNVNLKRVPQSRDHILQPE
jgi:hypothetical protein